MLLEHFQSLLNSRRSVDPDDRVIGDTVKSLRVSFKAALKRGGVRDVRWHDLRHSVSSWLGSRCTFACLRDLLAHSPGNVTSVYVHSRWSEQVEAIGSLPDLTKPAAKGEATAVVSG